MITQQMATKIIANIVQIAKKAEEMKLTNLRIFVPGEDDHLNKLHFLANGNSKHSIFDIGDFTSHIKDTLGCSAYLFLEEELTSSAKSTFIKKSTLFSEQNAKAVQEMLNEIVELNRDWDDKSDEEYISFGDRLPDDLLEEELSEVTQAQSVTTASSTSKDEKKASKEQTVQHSVESGFFRTYVTQQQTGVDVNCTLSASTAAINSSLTSNSSGASSITTSTAAGRASQQKLHDQPIEYKDIADAIVERYRSESGRRDINTILQYVATIVLSSLSISPEPDRPMSPKSPTT